MQTKEWWNISFLIYLIFLLTGFWLIFLYPKGEILLAINYYHHPILDLIFKHITFFGDGIFFLIILLILSFKKIKFAALFLITGVLQGVLVYLAKKVIFNGIVRPLKFFEGLENLYLVPGVEVHSLNSFPSGHTATAFSIAILVSIISRNQWYSACAMTLAILAAFSRVYLVQHFFIDIYFGSLTGILTAVSAYYFLNFVNQDNKFSILERSIFTPHGVPTLR